MEDGIPIFEHTSFYGYDVATSIVRILLTGQSPSDAGNLSGNVHHNVINMHYFPTIICPVIFRVFVVAS